MENVSAIGVHVESLTGQTYNANGAFFADIATSGDGINWMSNATSNIIVTINIITTNSVLFIL